VYTSGFPHIASSGGSPHRQQSTDVSFLARGGVRGGLADPGPDSLARIFNLSD
jgi:hypothetical protein